MAYRLTVSGKPIVCDTLDDLKLLLADEISKSGVLGLEHPQVSNENAIPQVKALADVGPAGRILLKLLATKDVVTDEEARDALGLADNKSLAAVLANVAKVFKAHEMANVVKTATRFANGSRHYVYSVSHETAAAIKVMGSEY